MAMSKNDKESKDSSKDKKVAEKSCPICFAANYNCMCGMNTCHICKKNFVHCKCFG